VRSRSRRILAEASSSGRSKDIGFGPEYLGKLSREDICGAPKNGSTALYVCANRIELTAQHPCRSVGKALSTVIPIRRCRVNA
jgi:hypothetical protein